MQSEKLKKTVSLSVTPHVAVYADSNPFWTITLTDGRKLYQDDDRPDIEEKSGWVRAVRFIYENGLEVSQVSYRFAGYEHVVWDLDQDKDFDGFYFAKGCAGVLSSENKKEWKYYAAGKVSGNDMYVSKYEVPFLELRECYKRSLKEQNLGSIIYKKEKR